MTTFLPHVRLTAGLALGLLLAASPARAQKEQPAGPASDGRFHRLEIYNGPLRSVHYYTDGLSATDRSSLGNLQRLENESALVDDLARLRYQYVRDERELQRRRTIVQNLLYGNSTTYGSGFYPGTIYGAYGFGYGFGGSGLPLGYAYPGVGTSAFYPGYVGSAGTTTQSLAFGIGDEGVIKNEIARVLAPQASPQYAAQVSSELSAARNAVARSEALAKGLGLPGKLTPAKTVKVTLKDGKIIEGTELSDDDNFIVVDTGKEEVTIRKSDGTVIIRRQK